MHLLSEKLSLKFKTQNFYKIKKYVAFFWHLWFRSVADPDWIRIHEDKKDQPKKKKLIRIRNTGF